MSKIQESVVALVRKEPGLRSVQISDRLDQDIEVVEGYLIAAVRAGQLLEELTPAPNGKETKCYRPNAGYLGWVAPGTLAGKEEKEDSLLTPSQRTVPATSVNTPVISMNGVRPPTRVTLALDHLLLHGATDEATLKNVMGLGPSQYVSQYLKAQIQSGKIIRSGDLFDVTTGGLKPSVQGIKSTTRKACKTGHTTPDPVHAPAHYTSGGIEVIDILRAKLSPDEFRGFLKGNVIKYTLRAELKNGQQDYQKAGVYMNWLSAHATPSNIQGEKK